MALVQIRGNQFDPTPNLDKGGGLGGAKDQFDPTPTWTRGVALVVQKDQIFGALSFY